MKKKLSIVLLSLAMVFNTCSLVGYADGGISVTLNGEALTFDVQPQLIDNRTMVPLRKIFEAMGAVVDWNDDTQTVTATKGNEKVVATINSKNVYINGETKTLDVPPMVIDDRTLVPVRFVAEAFGANVDWNESTQTVIIGTKQSQPEISLTTEALTTYKEYSHFGIKYKVPIEWKDPTVNGDNVYYYPVDGMITVQTTGDINGKLDENTFQQMLNGISKGIENYQLLSTDKTILPNNLESYVAEITGIISNHSMNMKLVCFQKDKSVIVLMCGDFGNSLKNRRQFDNMIKTISISNDNTIIDDNEKTHNQVECDFSSTTGIESYLYENYETLNSDIGEFKFKFYVSDSGYDSEDFSINIKANGPDLGLLFEYDTVVLGNYSESEIENGKKQLKEFMKNLATDLMEKMPNKKLTGSYHDSYYRYPNIKMDRIIEDYCTWANYDHGNDSAKVSTFRWLPNLDGRIEY